MATDVDICNIALARLGNRATLTSISPPEGSSEADHCARFYPLAKDQILRERAWSFAIRRARLAAMAEDPLGRGNAFGVPSDCLSIITVQPDLEGWPPRKFLEFAVESNGTQRVLICGYDPVWVRYTSGLTSEDSFPSDFADALAWLLASKLAGAIVTGTTGMDVAAKMTQMYLVALRTAGQHDASNEYVLERWHCDFLGDAADQGRNFDGTD